VSRDPHEQKACEIVIERREREEVERTERGAPPPIPFWKCIGFESLIAYLSHKKLEHRLERARRAARLNASLPAWKAFGFPSERMYRKRLRDTAD